MVVSFTPAGTVLTGAALDIRKTFDCGQCFRFAPDGGGYTGVAFGRVLHVTQDGGSIILHGVDRAAYEAVWADYFDLARDYEALSDAFCGDEALRTAYAFSRGIRILAQDPWETLCSFILSQNNNIPRIRKIIASLCERFGAPIAGTPFYAFPTAERLAEVGMEGLAEIRCGFRAKYVADAAARVASGARPRSAAEAVLRSGQSGADDGLRRGRQGGRLRAAVLAGLLRGLPRRRMGEKGHRQILRRGL